MLVINFVPSLILVPFGGHPDFTVLYISNTCILEQIYVPGKWYKPVLKINIPVSNIYRCLYIKNIRRNCTKILIGTIIGGVILDDFNVFF